jgi:Spy/CpxP family protein refolding chaperone
MSGTPLVSQVADAASPARPTHRSRTRPTIDDRVKVFAKNLDLSEAQQAAVKKILEQRQQETLRLRRDSSISGSARIAQFRALQDNTVERIRAVLNEEQRKRYDPLAVRRIQPAPDQRSVEDWIKATTPK